MITVRTNVSHQDFDAQLSLTITGRADLQKLQALLNRSLNCAPEFGEDWFALADRLEKFMIANKIPTVQSF